MLRGYHSTVFHYCGIDCYWYELWAYTCYYTLRYKFLLANQLTTLQAKFALIHDADCKATQHLLSSSLFHKRKYRLARIARNRCGSARSRRAARLRLSLRLLFR